MKRQRVGYMVFDVSEEWEQPLTLVFGEGLPERGLLDWAHTHAPFLFTSREEARAAITRTAHYGKAVEKPGMWPEAQNCKVRAVEAEKEQES